MEDTRARLLIIDDEDEIRDVLYEFLSQFHDCVAVDSAETALALVAEQSFDLIITDITMTQMSGLEMVPHIIELSPASAIIMISGQRTIEFAIDAMRAGAFDYVTKPFELSEVKEAVKRALDHLAQSTEQKGQTRHSPNLRAFRAAFENDQFVVHYQPKVEIESRKLLGVEALVRWNHPHFGLLPPSEFIGEAEECGFIVELGSLVLRTACLQARRWQNAGLTSLHVAVNVSPKQFQEGRFFETVVECLGEAGLEPAWLQLELTETSLLEDNQSTLNVLHELRELGVKIAIDDFGTGYSSLGYLKRLPIDFVKLDRSFVSGATTSPDDAALVMGIITLAHNLRLKVVAEGVDSDELLTFLRLLRCDEGQGYLFGKPVPPELIERFAKTRQSDGPPRREIVAPALSQEVNPLIGRNAA